MKRAAVLAAFAVVTASIGVGYSVWVPEGFKVEMRQEGEVVTRNLVPSRTGIVVVDTWDSHWCSDLAERTLRKGLAINPVVERLRENGATVIWAPSATNINAPAQIEARDRALALPDAPMPEIKVGRIAGGVSYFRGKKWVRCVTGERPPRSIRRYVHPGMEVQPTDYWTTTRQGVWNIAQHHGLDTLLYAGFAANNCVSNRPFGLTSMKALGLDAYLIRDLTDLDRTMLDPPMSHEDALDEWVKSVEPTIGPTLLSGDLVRAISPGDHVRAAWH